MKPNPILIFIALLFGLVSTGNAQQITKELIKFNNKDRAYYLFVPEKLDKAKPAPLIVMLHGSGRTGNSLVEKWKDLAKKEGIIIVGPDSTNSASWNVPLDAPDFLYELVEFLKGKYPVNARRVYLFGHSAGAVVSFYVALMESQYFAAAAIHAGSMNSNDGPIFDRAKRKIPIAIWSGTNDNFFPIANVRATRDMLNTRGFNAQLTEMKGHTHDYYGSSTEINQSAWDFLKVIELPEEPKYERYKWSS